MLILGTLDRLLTEVVIVIAECFGFDLAPPVVTDSKPGYLAPGFPVPMILFCPCCGGKHVDKNEWAATRTHRTHLCEYCSNKWTPANVPTVGVEVLP